MALETARTLARGAPAAYGFEGEVWTCERVAEVILKEFGVSYHPAHVSRLVRESGLSLQKKPMRRANPAGRGGHNKALEGRALALPQQEAIEEDRTILLVDQSGFYLLPAVVRTYAPIGRTPILHERLSREHLSAMSGVTPEGKLLMMMEQERTFEGPDVVRFLEHALRQIPGKLLVISGTARPSIAAK